MNRRAAEALSSAVWQWGFQFSACSAAPRFIPLFQLVSGPDVA